MIHERIDHLGILRSTRVSRENILPLHTLEANQLTDVIVAHLMDRESLHLHLRATDTILTIVELHDAATGITDRPIMLGHQILHGLHHLPLDITRLSRLNSRIDQTLTP